MAVWLGAVALLNAQDGPPPQDPNVPERGVARVSIAGGEVNVRRGDSGDWVAAVVNAPVMVEDRVATGAGARAEVQFDSSNLIRIGANAEIRLAELAVNHYHLQVAHGTVTYRVLRESQAMVEVDTPSVSLRPQHVGVYRVYVQPDGQTEITVRMGEVEVASAKGTQQLRAGETMLARGNPADPEFRVDPAIARDSWDAWNEQRDQEMLASPSYNIVPHDMYGAEDLDQHGQWVDVPSYGKVWSPDVDPDWAPYQNGRWVWEDYYGWTWVSSDPWGWAPFHYGRWFYSAGYGWCWYPGLFGRHYWSPALVGFFGFGGGIGVGFGFGNVGWVPLAPFEPLYAWWGHGYYAGFRNPAFFNRGANITHVNITNIYRNARVSNGVSAVSAADFRSGRFTSIARPAGAQIREAGLVRGQLPLSPTAASLRYSNRAVTSVPRAAENQRFFGRNAAAPVQRVPFADQQRAMQQFSRQSAAPAMSRGPVTGPATPNVGGWRPAAATPSVGAGQARPPAAWRPVTPPTAVPAPNSGWQRFGESRPRTAVAPRPYDSTGSATSYRPPAASNGMPQSIRVAPPIVHERTSTTATRATSRSQSAGHASSGAAHSSGGSHGGGGRR